MRIGLVSDTHDNAVLSAQAAAFFAREGHDLVLHLGDVTTPATKRLFEELPLVVLRGNNDFAIEGLSDSWEHVEGEVRLGATHGHLRDEMARLLGSCDVVFHGHTHMRRRERMGRALVVNPGALQRARVHTIATMDTRDLSIAFHAVTPDGVLTL